MAPTGPSRCCLLRLCSGSDQVRSPSAQVCSPSTQIKAAAAHVRRVKRNQRG
ncbi:hypothetical protein BDZ45DRAFT_675645 [Acephala macrosclerotiorum]|nr:hypothetical protein BDZ45DRAFT_675645 [Acephala macrosclerotiorum]